MKYSKTILKDKEFDKLFEVEDFFMREDNLKYYFLNSTYAKSRYSIVNMLF